MRPTAKDRCHSPGSGNPEAPEPTIAKSMSETSDGSTTKAGPLRSKSGGGKQSERRTAARPYSNSSSHDYRAIDLLKRDPRPMVAAAQWLSLTAVCIAIIPWLLISRAAEALDLKRRAATIAFAAIIAAADEIQTRNRKDHR